MSSHVPGGSLAQALGPVEDGLRIRSVDVIRGVALLGVFVENIQRYTAPLGGRMDLLAARFVHYAVEGNSYPIYSFLFGLGVAIQFERAEAPGRGTVRLHLRRMGALLVMGLAFFLFLDPNLVLINYALLGVLLAPFRRMAPRSILIAGLTVLALAVILPPLESPLLALMGPGGAAGANTALVEERARLSVHMATGSYSDFVTDNLKYLGLHWRLPSFYWWWAHILAMFLLGMWAHRDGMFTRTEEHLQVLRRCARVTAVLAVLGIFVANLSAKLSSPLLGMPWARDVRVAVHTLGSSSAAIFIIAALTLLMRRARPARVLHPLTYAGRLSLTGFVLQSVVMTPLFYGFGLDGKMGVAVSLLLVAGVFAVQVWLSAMWLRRFSQGPLEWVWRSAVYGVRLPMRTST